MKIAIWAEHTLNAGHRDCVREDDGDWDSDEVDVYEGDNESMSAQAKMLDKKRSAYGWEAARTIRWALGIE